jgi:hypothetical protein
MHLLEVEFALKCRKEPQPEVPHPSVHADKTLKTAQISVFRVNQRFHSAFVNLKLRICGTKRCVDFIMRSYSWHNLMMRRTSIPKT